MVSISAGPAPLALVARWGEQRVKHLRLHRTRWLSKNQGWARCDRKSLLPLLRAAD